MLILADNKCVVCLLPIGKLSCDSNLSDSLGSYIMKPGTQQQHSSLPPWASRTKWQQQCSISLPVCQRSGDRYMLHPTPRGRPASLCCLVKEIQSSVISYALHFGSNLPNTGCSAVSPQDPLMVLLHPQTQFRSAALLPNHRLHPDPAGVRSMLASSRVKPVKPERCVVCVRVYKTTVSPSAVW